MDAKTASNLQMAPLPDIVRDAELETYFHSDCTVHIFIESGPDVREVRREEYWKRRAYIGAGAFGQCWLEECIQGQRELQVRAVKEVARSLGESKRINYHRELEAIAKFSNPRYERCFVKCFGWFQNDDKIFITMEYLKDGDLQKYLYSVPPLPEADAQQISFQVLQGLDFMHENGFSHRDLKPGNILIRAKPPKPWWVKLSDFGISKRATDNLAISSAIGGTMRYMAPELFGYVDTADKSAKAADMWALGEIAFQILTKDQTFDEPRLLRDYTKSSDCFPTALLRNHEVSEAGISFVLGLMQPQPEARWTAARALSQPWVESCRSHISEKVSHGAALQFTAGAIPPAAEQDSLFIPSGRWSTGSMIAAQSRSLLTTPRTTVSKWTDNDVDPGAGNEQISLVSYTIGWIILLPVFQIAATSMLDEKHETPKDFIGDQSDKNNYIWGRIGEHNVVIVCSTVGEYGTASATYTSKELPKLLPQLRICLLIGLGSGVPGRTGILLGDVVVSHSRNGKVGVVQYDITNHSFDIKIRKRLVIRPPDALISAIAEIQKETGSLLTENLEVLKGMTVAHSYPGAEKDILRGGSRRQRDSPAIHYGMIAASNTIPKNSKMRDELIEHLAREKVEPICFAMESAGTMNDIPGLVICGICDYADEHQDANWHRYAAATAAAFAKKLLGHIAVGESILQPSIEDPDPIADAKSALDLFEQKVPVAFIRRNFVVDPFLKIEHHIRDVFERWLAHKAKHSCLWILDEESTRFSQSLVAILQQEKVPVIFYFCERMDANDKHLEPRQVLHGLSCSFVQQLLTYVINRQLPMPTDFNVCAYEDLDPMPESNADIISLASSLAHESTRLLWVIDGFEWLEGGLEPDSNSHRQAVDRLLTLVGAREIESMNQSPEQVRRCLITTKQNSRSLIKASLAEDLYMFKPADHPNPKRYSFANELKSMVLSEKGKSI